MRLLDLLLLAAAACLAVGFAMIYLPLAPIVAGVCCAAAWWLLGDVSPTGKARR